MRNDRSATAIAIIALALGACSSNNNNPVPPPPSNQIVVNPGQSIQSAVDSAKAGFTVLVMPGTYHESGRTCAFDKSQTCAVSVTQDNISLIAKSSASKPVVLENQGNQTNGIGVGKSYSCPNGSNYHVNGSHIKGFTVIGFKGSGIELDCVDNWQIEYNITRNDVLYGLYPVWAGKGRVNNNVASGATDTGIYVGISHDIRVDHNTAYQNVTGFEFENTINSQLDHNVSVHNTAGILEFIIPGDPLERSENNVVSDNLVHENNSPNKCSVPTDPVCLVPPGTGLGVIGGNGNVTSGNTVTNNKSYGIAVADVCTGFVLTAQQCKALPFNPLPLNIHTVSNTALNNGIDMIWTQNGSGNCWLNNRAPTTSPSTLPRCSSAR
jgi:parallel beta-helix repeat protein